MAKARIQMVRCGTCRGTGHVELTGIYAETLDLLRRDGRTLIGRELAELAGCSNEAMCNRLRRIERYGLVKSRKHGREVHWTAL